MQDIQRFAMNCYFHFCMSMKNSVLCTTQNELPTLCPGSKKDKRLIPCFEYFVSHNLGQKFCLRRGAKKNFALGGSGLWLENLKVLWPHNAGLVWFDFICPEKWISRGDVPSQDVKIRASSDVLRHGIYKASH